MKDMKNFKREEKWCYPNSLDKSKGERKLPLLVFTTLKRLSPVMARLKWITPRSTLTISNVEEAHDTEQGKFSVFPALRVEMEPKNPADLHTCTSCPVQTHGTVRDGKIWRAQHRTGELQFKICLKDVTEDLYSPQEAKPCCPLPEIMSKGTHPMWLSKLHASPSSLPPPLRMPFGLSIFVPFLRQSHTNFTPVTQISIPCQSVEIILAAQCWKMGETNDNVIRLMKCENFVEIVNFKNVIFCV